MATPYPTSYNCPICHSDRTAPVPGIVREQSTGTRTAGSTYQVASVHGAGFVPVFGSFHSKGRSQTDLASALNLDTKRLGAASGCGTILIVVGLIITIIGIVAGVSAGAPVLSEVGALFLLSGWMPLVGLLILYGVRKQRPLVHVATQIWNTARYCYTDDVVYLPDGTYAQPGGTNQMIYAVARTALAQGNER